MSTKVAMYTDQDCLIVPIQTELRDKEVDQIQFEILDKVRDARLRNVIIDLSSVTLLDSYQAQKIFNIAKMTKLLGAATLFTGLNSGMVISLIDIGFEPDKVLTATSLDEGLEMLRTINNRDSEQMDEENDMDTENYLEKETDS